MTRTQIRNVDELMSFLKTNYDNLTESQFEQIISTTLNVWVTGKPKDFNTAQAKLITYLMKYENDIEKPLFLEMWNTLT